MTPQTFQPPRHVIGLAQGEGEVPVGAEHATVWRAVCVCGWRAWVAATDRELALEQGRKHANQAYKWPTTTRTLNLSLTLKADDLAPEQVREIIRDAVKATNDAEKP